MNNYKVELADGRSIVLIYVKDFEWYNKQDEHLLKGHPFPGRVYRAIKADQEGAYYVKIDSEQFEPDVLGIKIMGSQETTRNWAATIEEINDENITDFSIEDSDYLKIGTWLKDGHSDFVQLIDKINNTPVMEIEVEAEDMEEAKEKVLGMIRGSIDNFNHSVTSKVKELAQTDPMQLEAVDAYLEFVINDLKEEDPDMISLSREVALHSKYGKGANLFNAINHLQQYLNPKSSNKEHLLKAIQAISYEITRLKFNGNNE
jgi:hypothetical protein